MRTRWSEAREVGLGGGETTEAVADAEAEVEKGREGAREGGARKREGGELL